MKPNGEIDDHDNIEGSDFEDNSNDTKAVRYNPTKPERVARKRIWDRYRDMADNQDRKDAELEWEMADKEFRMWAPERDDDDWRANLVLPDAFSAIQAEMQETIERQSRPELESTDTSDDREAKEHFCNAILNHNMDDTNFDFEYFKAKYAAAIRGTAFLWEYYRVDRREVHDAEDVDEDGEITYKKKTRIDFDDAFTEFVPNEEVFVDDAAREDDECRDVIRREIIHIDEFKRKYSLRPDFIPKNVDKVRPGGDTRGKEFFKMPSDMDNQDVEVLHYYNRAIDRYDVLANNVIVRLGYLPSKHKELPFASVHHYRILGRYWGMGVAKVVYSLSEERRSLRMLNLDRQKMQMNKMFIVNDQINLDDEDLIVRPHGMIEVNTNGLPLNNAILPLEYGDVSASYFQTEEILLEDIRRASGIDDRIANANSGATATEAAMVQQTSQKRINMISILTEMSTMKRIGRIKWSNIQFFYPAGKVADIEGDSATRAKKYKRVKVKDQVFDISEDTKTKQRRLVVSDFDGSTIVELNKSWATFMGGDFTMTMQSEAHTMMSKPIRQAKANELLAGIAANPVLLATLDPNKAVKQMLILNDFSPKQWMKGTGMSTADWMQMANNENYAMSQGEMLNGTPGATQEHTMIHLMYTESEAFAMLSSHNQQIIKNHILQEHDNNPLTKTSGDALKQAQADAASGQDTPGGMPATGVEAALGTPGGAPGSAGPTGNPTPGGAPMLNNQPMDMTAQNPNAGAAEGASPNPDGVTGAPGA